MLTALWDCNNVPLLPDSSLSQWVHACDALDLPMLQREELDAFIDQLYKDIEKGEALHGCGQCQAVLFAGDCWRLLPAFRD